MRTKQQYIAGLKKMRRNIYYDGHLIDRDDELQMPCIDVMGLTFEKANDPEYKDLIQVKSHLTGETINRFTHIHQSKEDLHKKQDMTRALCRLTHGCIQRCMGIDASNSINAISYEADKENKGATQYHKNFIKWLERFQKDDLVGCCAQTDVKGDRMKRPSQQKDPDVYLHVVERKKDGIVVRGCKLHISEASVADEILVVPTRSLLPEEKDWAVAFAIPADWEGVKQVVTIRNFRERKHFKKGFVPGSTDSYIIFDNAFIPWERVFLCGEAIHGSVGALLFALFHRHSYSGCKPAVGDLMLGTVALAAEYNGIQKASHVRDKLAELISIAELGYAAGFTASELGKPEVYMPGAGFVPYGPGSYIPNSIYCNVGRRLSGEAVYREAEILTDISGGIPATFPHEADFLNPETGDFLRKYTMRNPDIDIENAIKLWMHVGDMLCSAASGVMKVGNYHGGGSPIMESIAITTQYDIESRKNMVKRNAGMKK
jgi:4-hydroxybutyryl-CoA dehydratase/vinylacetyl-CoA-Delta-isomerase